MTDRKDRRHAHTRLRAETGRMVRGIFDRLDYARLGSIYCDEGGEAFWKARRRACEKLGLDLAAALRSRLKTGGRSLYVGAGVAELPLLIMERLELKREVAAFNLRAEEVALLNEALAPLDIELHCADAGRAAGRFDHLAMISTLNDPERFPHLSALSYGRADPSTFDPKAFAAERRTVLALADACLGKLTAPALVTTSVEEVVWITNWCARQEVSCRVGMTLHPTAIVEDPVCVIQVGVRP